MRRVALAAALCCALASSSFAELVNGDFSTGLVGWSHGEPPAVPSPTGYWQSAVNEVDGAGAGHLLLAGSGWSSSLPPKSYVDPLTLDLIFPDPGAAFAPRFEQTFPAQQGQNVLAEIGWDLLTSGFLNGSQARFSVLLTGPGETQALDRVAPNTGGRLTGSALLSFPITADGDYTLRFSVLGNEGTVGQAGLVGGFSAEAWVDNVQLTAVPEPSTLALAALAVVMGTIRTSARRKGGRQASASAGSSRSPSGI